MQYTDIVSIYSTLICILVGDIVVMFTRQGMVTLYLYMIMEGCVIIISIPESVYLYHF